jgi:hypothetical protein
MNQTEIESRPEERCNSIRCDSDSIRFRFDADWVPIQPGFKSASIRFYFDSIRFDSIRLCTSCDVLIIIIIITSIIIPQQYFDIIDR